MPSPKAIHTLIFDFDGVFTDNKVWVDQDGREFVRCDRRDGLAFDLLRAYQQADKLDTEVFILSKERNPVVQARARKLKLNCHGGIQDKLVFLQRYLGNKLPEVSDPFKGVVYLGNDLNDVPLMRRAGFSVAPGDAHPRVQQIANLVMPQNGGEGFIRAFIEEWLGINQLTTEELDELISRR